MNTVQFLDPSKRPGFELVQPVNLNEHTLPPTDRTAYPGKASKVGLIASLVLGVSGTLSPERIAAAGASATEMPLLARLGGETSDDFAKIREQIDSAKELVTRAHAAALRSDMLIEQAKMQALDSEALSLSATKSANQVAKSLKEARTPLTNLALAKGYIEARDREREMQNRFLAQVSPYTTNERAQFLYCQASVNATLNAIDSTKLPESDRIEFEKTRTMILSQLGSIDPSSDEGKELVFVFNRRGMLEYGEIQFAFSQDSGRPTPEELLWRNAAKIVEEGTAAAAEVVTKAAILVASELAQARLVELATKYGGSVAGTVLNNAFFLFAMLEITSEIGCDHHYERLDKDLGYCVQVERSKYDNWRASQERQGAPIDRSEYIGSGSDRLHFRDTEAEQSTSIEPAKVGSRIIDPGGARIEKKDFNREHKESKGDKGNGADTGGELKMGVLP